MAMWIYCPRTPNFNSRPSARGDLFPMTLTEVPILFQFTPLREGRPEVVGGAMTNLNISIHAPPRGATLRGLRHQLPVFYFNSRPSARGDIAWVNGVFFRAYFNSRPSARGDGSVLRNRYAIEISIHAPPRGATGTAGSRESGCPCISIHAPPRGATRQRLGWRVGSCISIHAPPRGATQAYSMIETGKRISIHAPPRGATQQPSMTA